MRMWIRPMLRKRVYDNLAARWTELGLSGHAPAVLAYELDDEHRDG